MKIIATTGDGYLCELSRKEVHIIFNSVSPKIGDENDLARAYDTLTSLRGLSDSQLKYLGRNIEGLIKKFREIEEEYDKLMIIDTLKHVNSEH